MVIFFQINDFSVSNSEIPPLYIITPTYRRPEQLAELTRLAHTIMLTPNVHWLVIEDAEQKTELVTDLLERTGLSYSHLLGKEKHIYHKLRQNLNKHLEYNIIHEIRFCSEYLSKNSFNSGRTKNHCSQEKFIMRKSKWSKISLSYY